MRTVWAPSERTFARSGGSRASFESYAPGGPAVSYIQHTGSNKINEYRPEELWFKADAARLTTQIYIPPGFQSIGGRLAIGIRGGEDPKAGCLSGGCPPAEQKAFSVRVNYSRGEPTPLLYSYHLNRKKGVRRPDDPRYDGGAHYGTGPQMDRPIPEGEWVTMVLEVVMNDIGADNGMARLAMYGADGRLIDRVEIDRAVFRQKPSWDSMGIILTEKTSGGGKENRGAPQEQKMYYRGFRLEIGTCREFRSGGVL